MKPIAKIICGCIALGWLQVAVAQGVTVREQNGSVVLELIATPDAAQPEPGVAPVTRVPVGVHYEKVDRANIEKRMDDRAARTRKRKADAGKDAAERAAKAQLNPAIEQVPDTRNP